MLKRYTFRDYWKSYEGMSLLWLDTSYRDIYKWWNPKRYRLRGKLWEAWYYLKCKVWHRYSTVTPRSLPPTWCDRDHLMLHAAFEILMDYYEKESAGRWTVQDLEKVITDPEADEPSRDWCQYYLPIATEIEALYRWWTVERPERMAEYERRLTVWADLYKKQRDDYTTTNPGWQETDNPRLKLHSLPPDAPEPDGLSTARQAMDELSEEIMDEEDNRMLKRLIDVRLSMWT